MSSLYSVWVRDSMMKVVGLLDDFTSLDWVSRYNDVGSFVLQTSKYSPNASLLKQGNGIVIADTYFGNVLFSGPIAGPTRSGAGRQSLQVRGFCDNVWLKWRRALPYASFAHTVTLQSPARWYRCNDGGGMGGGLIDVGSSGVAATLAGATGISLQQSGGVFDDTNMAIMTQGAAGYAWAAATGLPSGNAPWTMGFLMQVPGWPAAGTTATVWGWGSAAAQSWVACTLNASGALQADHYALGGVATANGAITTGIWHSVVLKWDGTTEKMWLDGQLVGSATLGTALTVGTTGLTIGGGQPAALGGAPVNPYTGLVDEVWVVSGALADATCLQLSQLAVAPNANQQYDTETGQASSVMLSYVAANLSNNAQPDRYPGAIVVGANGAQFMSTAADPHIGTTVAWSARHDNLLKLCQMIALGGGDFGFRVQQVANGGGAALQFTTYQPTTRSGIVLSEQLGTLSDYDYAQDTPGANCILVGGSGSGTSRAFVALFDPATTAIFGRIEDFVDARNVGDGTSLKLAGNDRLTRDSMKQTIAPQPNPTGGMVYPRDYGLGDKIVLTGEWGTVTDVVREVHGSLTPGGADLIVPVIGSQDASATFDQESEFLTQLKRQGQKIYALDTVV